MAYNTPANAATDHSKNAIIEHVSLYAHPVKPAIGPFILDHIMPHFYAGAQYITFVKIILDGVILPWYIGLTFTGGDTMKAIQIKYMPATATQPARLKAWTEAGNIVHKIDGRLEISDEAILLAERYVKKFNWGKICGFGSLPNGDWVATIAAA